MSSYLSFYMQVSSLPKSFALLILMATALLTTGCGSTSRIIVNPQGTTPTITTLSATTGAAGTTITITGTNLGSTQGSSTVEFNGTIATVTSWSNTSIVVTVPAGATSGNVVVTVAGVASNGVGFTVQVNPTPTLTSLSATSGAIGDSITITGANLGSTQGSSTVEFNGTIATVTSWSSTSIVVIVPAGATSGNAVVTVASVASNGLAFTVLATPAPTLTVLSPSSGTFGTPITISGSDFGATEGRSTVDFNGTPAIVISWSSTEIVVHVPVGATSGNVVVTVSGVVSNGLAFTFVAPVLPTHAQVVTAIEDVNNYWIATHPAPALGDNDWDSSTYYTGDLAAYDATGVASYLTRAEDWATEFNYGLLRGNSTNNADSQAAGQGYIRLYELNPVASDLIGITTSLNDMVTANNYGVWSWVDALNMSMPVFAELGVLKGDLTYLNTMYLLYENTKITQGLYDSATGLWWRDNTYINSGIHWSRGNGWAFAALTKTLNVLPHTDPHYTEYLNDYLGMAHELATLQQPDGYWNTDLTGAEYAGPESSGTGFFLFGIAWGINNGLLDSSYLPVVDRAWNYFTTTAMQSVGNTCCLLGYEQPADVGPAPSTDTDTANFGVGAFLLAARQMELMTK